MFLLAPKKPKSRRAPNRFAGSVADNIRQTQRTLDQHRRQLSQNERRQVKQDEAFRDIAHHVKRAEFNAAAITARYAGFDRACAHFENAAVSVNRNRLGSAKDVLACAGAEIKQIMKVTRNENESLKQSVRLCEKQIRDLECR